MTEQEQKRDVFIEKKARALTMMLLTRHERLLIEEPKDDIGLDYIVRFHTAGKVGIREFGIQLKGTRTAASKEEAGKALCPALREMKRYGPFLRPVCLFCFTMDNDGGWYTWVAEPVESEDGKPVLRSCDEPDCRPLDKRALKEIIEQVDSWHDALFPSLVVNGPAGGKAGRRGAKQ
jgi:hypothetical protein